jgi:hypothetical protein
MGDGERLLRLAGARLLVAEGRFADALTALAAVPTPVPIANPAWDPSRGIAAAALAGLGRVAEAVGLQETEVELLRRWGAPTALGSALVRLGLLRGDDGVGHLREAVTLLDRTQAAVELAGARCALGSSPGVPDTEAVPLLRAALATAAERGAVDLRERARAALAARGCPQDGHRDLPRRPSATERRILELVAAGAGVREVAQRLFLTPGTVQAVLESASGGALTGASSPPQVPGGTV